jgi:hypothetical protein
LDVPKLRNIPWRGERHRNAFASGTTGTSDAVDVAFGILRHVIVEDMRDAFYIEAACGYICRYEQLKFRFTERLHHLLPLVLGQVPVQFTALEPHLLEFFIQFGSPALGTAENNSQIRTIRIQHIYQCLLLTTVCCLHNDLTDLAHGNGRSRFHFDINGFVHIDTSQLANTSWHRSGKQHGLSPVRNLLKNRFHIVQEAHV